MILASGSSRRRGGSSRRGKAAAKKAPAPSGPLGAMALASAVSSGCNMASNAKSVTDKQLGKMGADLEAMEAAIQKKKLAHIDSKTKSACRYAGRVLAARPRDAAVMALFGRLDTVEAQAVKIAAQQLADYRMPKNLGSVKKHHAGIAKAVKKDLPDDPRKILQIRTPDDFKYVAPFNNERRLAAVIAFSVPGEKRKCHIVNYTLRQSRVSGNKWSTITYYSRGMAEFKILCKNVKK